MYISKIELLNFGPIKHASFNLYSDKINLIIGCNASGKTNMLAAIYSLFYDDSILNFCSDSELFSEVNIALNNGCNHITKKYSTSSSELILNQFKDIYYFASIKRDHIFFCNNESLRKNRNFTKENIRKSIEFIEASGINNMDMQQLLKDQIESADRYIYLSGGEQAFINLIWALSKIPKDSIFIGDSLFCRFDSKTVQFVLSIIQNLVGIQFVLLENAYLSSDIKDPDIHIQYLDNDINNETRSPIAFNYSFNFEDKIKIEENHDNGKKIEVINYRIGDKIPEEECRDTEFKEVKGENPCNSIIKNAEIYIISYLNSQVSDTGTILFGISDDKIVKGVNLTYADKDKIRREISELIKQAEPYISPDLYTINFKEIVNGNGILKDTYIVEIVVKSCDSELLYCTSRGEVFIKTEGGKTKLTPTQIQREILLRSKKIKRNKVPQ